MAGKTLNAQMSVHNVGKAGSDATDTCAPNTRGENHTSPASLKPPPDLGRSLVRLTLLLPITSAYYPTGLLSNFTLSVPIDNPLFNVLSVLNFK